jgi:cobyrinic acid a,c-diamide synthase
MALIIAGERSGVGKTTVTLAMLSWLTNRQKQVQSFKVGPDYIDPLFHRFVTGKPCRNLDPILTSPEYVQWCFAYHSQQAKFSLIEGVMGLFDGLPLNNQPDYGSSAYIAKLLNLPVVLIIDCSCLSISVGAIASGYANFDSEVKIVGLILNKVSSDKHLAYLKEGLKSLSIPIMGVIYRKPNIELPSRHLGLIPAGEIEIHQQVMQQLQHLAEVSFRWDLLIPYLANSRISISPNGHDYFNLPVFKPQLKIAVADDQAFNFYYQDNLDILTKLGTEIIFFSPLNDDNLPEDIAGLYLGGGFPEIFAQQLAENIKLKTVLREQINQQIPIYAECGGMIYLSQSITDFEGKKWQMLGILPNQVIMSQKLTLGYRQVRVLNNSCFANQNNLLWGHEFHRGKNLDNPQPALLEIKDMYQQKIIGYQGWQSSHIFASYLHFHFASFVPQVQIFWQQCRKYQQQQN